MQAADSVQQSFAASVVAQALNWARCHPGILFLGSLALTALVTKADINSEMSAGHPLESKADLVDDEVPLFI